MKQTEIGLIPDDWEVKTLNDYFDIGSSKRVFQSQWRKSGIPFYRAREIVILAEKNSVENDLFIDEDLYNQYKNLYGVPAVNDLLVTGVGTLGKVYKIQNNKPFYFKDGNIICLKNKGNIDSDYVKYHFDYPIVKDQINDNSGKSTVGTYTINSARKTTLPIPPLAEQQRIAKALSDVDALIFTTEKLFQKKKNIKQGTMQNLLTGKKRLPDFAPVVVEPVETTGYKQTELGLIPEDWEVKSFDVLFDICTETVPLADINQKYYVGTENMMQDKKGVVENSIELKYQSVREYLKEDILISNIRPYLKKVWFADKNGGCSTDVLVFRNKRMQNDSLFLFMLVSADRFFQIVNDNAVGTKMPRGDKNIIKQILFALPSSKKEQTAIANVLSSMDKEIETLNTKLEKYRNLKTAMMQQLLTGKIRLVK